MATAVPIDPRKLIAHARDLAAHHEGAGRPRPIWLRRAVSASYYAIFHGLALATATQVLPSGTEEERCRLCRSLEHGALADVCGWIGGQPGAGKEHVKSLVRALQDHRDIRELAGILVGLQENRHLADYDHLTGFDKAGTLTLIAQAERGLDILDRLVGTRNLERFLALVAFHTRLR